MLYTYIYYSTQSFIHIIHLFTYLNSLHQYTYISSYYFIHTIYTLLYILHLFTCYSLHRHFRWRCRVQWVLVSRLSHSSYIEWLVSQWLRYSITCTFYGNTLTHFFLNAYLMHIGRGVYFSCLGLIFCKYVLQFCISFQLLFIIFLSSRSHQFTYFQIQFNLCLDSYNFCGFNGIVLVF